MEVSAIKGSNNNYNNISDIKSAWFLIIMMMKMTTDVDEKRKIMNSNDVQQLFDEFEENKKKWVQINEELEKLNINSLSCKKEIQELQDKQTECSIKSQDIQNQMKRVFTVKVKTLFSDNYCDLQTAYKMINDMFKKNPSLDKLGR